MVKLRRSNEEFFESLTTLLATQSSAARGSIFLTQKRLCAETSPEETGEKDASNAQILIRATDGNLDKAKKVKVSTVVSPDDIESFYAKYAEVCRAGMMGGMKKRDRAGKKKKAKGNKVAKK